MIPYTEAAYATVIFMLGTGLLIGICCACMWLADNWGWVGKALLAVLVIATIYAASLAAAMLPS